MEISSSSHNFTLSRNFGFAIRSQHKSKMPPSLPMPPAPVRRPAALRLKAATECGSCAPELLETEEWREMLKWGDKCRGSSSGVVELLECLEREAIMGEDEGRDPVDYNRRAQIFNTSSRVFQALIIMINWNYFRCIFHHIQTSSTHDLLTTTKGHHRWWLSGSVLVCHSQGPEFEPAISGVEGKAIKYLKVGYSTKHSPPTTYQEIILR